MRELTFHLSPTNTFILSLYETYYYTLDLRNIPHTQIVWQMEPSKYSSNINTIKMDTQELNITDKLKGAF